VREIIYDVGVNDGCDTAYYLHKGFRVVGIEASPVAAQRLRERFAAEIADGSFILLNIGIAAEAGEFPFWICDDHPEWSSFDPDIASRQSCKHHSVNVITATFSDVVAEYGVPYFCKIDIEGNDALCVEGLTPLTAPPYISIELNPLTESAIWKLAKLGYTGFKIISQNTLATPNRLISTAILNLPSGKLLYPCMGLERRLRGRLKDGDWRFAFGSSGPFAEETGGKWETERHVTELWHSLRKLNAKWKVNDGGGDWYDLHAKL